MARYDFLQLKNAIVISDNDIVIAESDQQHIQDLINAHYGWIREFPLTGAKASDYINAPANNLAKFEGDIKTALKSDGYLNKKVIVNEFTTQSQDINIYDQD
mgnify:CR=1 FL=1